MSIDVARQPDTAQHDLAEDGDVLVVLDDRALASGLSGLRHAVSAAIVGGGSRVVVDIARLERLSSGTVAALLWANRHCTSRGGRVVLLNPSEPSLAVLRRTGLGDVLPVRTEPVMAS